jgi:uncharacterized protein YcaQ
VPLTVSREQARRFLVRHQLLAPPRSLPASPDSVLRVIDRLGFLQFDPLEVPGARNHDLMLHSRIAGYRREWTDQWLYGTDRRLIELYNKSLNIVPLAELPHYRLTWDRNASDYGAGILQREGAVADAILARIREEGPLSTAAFVEHGHSVDWWWAPTRASRAVLEALFVSGRVGISRRDGNRRYYDLIENIVPAALLADRASEDDARRHRLLSRFRAGGLVTAGGNELMFYAHSREHGPRLTRELVEAGAIEPVEIEGLKSPRYMPADERALLEDASPTPPAVAFVAPVDPLVAGRKQLLELWDFDYRWEIFYPPAKRKFGYYVLPILFGDRFVGRIEPRFDKSDRTAGAVRILGLWWEKGFSPRGAEGFVPAFREALAAYLRFVGAERVEWPPTLSSVGRLIGRIKRAGLP